jgi:phosphate transport system permease protein
VSHAATASTIPPGTSAGTPQGTPSQGTPGQGTPSRTPPSSRHATGAAARASSTGDRIFLGATLAAGLFVLVLLGAIILELYLGGREALARFGLEIIADPDWDPVQETGGGLVPI